MKSNNFDSIDLLKYILSFMVVLIHTAPFAECGGV